MTDGGPVAPAAAYEFTFASATDSPAVEAFLLANDDAFFPPLTARNGAHREYIATALGRGRIALSTRKGTLVGVCLYWYEGTTIRVSATVVTERLRGSRLLFALLRWLAQREVEAGRAVTIRTKTWTTNVSLRSALPKLGFQVVETIPGDLHPDRVSEIWEASFQAFAARIGALS